MRHLRDAILEAQVARRHYFKGVLAEVASIRLRLALVEAKAVSVIEAANNEKGHLGKALEDAILNLEEELDPTFP